jgi:hypothetical protein
MPHTTTLVIAGRLTTGGARGPYGGAIVCVHINEAERPVAMTTTDQFGRFELPLEVGRHTTLTGERDGLVFCAHLPQERAAVPVEADRAY